MKKIITMLLFCICAISLHAQKCLDINIQSQMGHLEVPGGSASCFGACTTQKNDEHQTVIVTYGTQYTQLDELVTRTGQDFTNATMTGGGMAGQGMSSGQVQDAKALAAKLQAMSEDERKAYVTQMVQNMQANRQVSAANTESPAVAKMVIQTRDIVTRQLKAVDDELAAKFRELLNEEKQQRDAVKRPSDNQCPPVDKVGMPSCACVNGLAGKYWEKILAIQDNINERKAALLQSYIPRMKALIGQVEDNISKLQFGAAVKTTLYKKLLFSAQSGAFGFAFDVTGSIVKDIRKTGSDTFVNKYNSDKLVYDLSCSHQK
jgi:hypothetical protein